MADGSGAGWRGILNKAGSAMQQGISQATHAAAQAAEKAAQQVSQQGATLVPRRASGVLWACVVAVSATLAACQHINTPHRVMLTLQALMGRRAGQPLRPAA
jgi:hypothetical protein